MFTDPEKKFRGTLCSLPVPTYEAVKGILRSVYWKPTFIWVPDELRIMNAISFEKFSIKQRRKGVSEFIDKQRLCNVCYQLRAHFVWNENRPELAADRDENKHFRIALRSLSRGGRRAVYLGTADCTGYVRSVRFGSGKGFYDGCDRDFGEMYHGITYPDENLTGQNSLDVFRRSFRCIMSDGIIRFPPLEECSSKFLRRGAIKRFGTFPLNV